MLSTSRPFSSFAVRDLDATQRFYADTLGLRVERPDEAMALLQLQLPGDTTVMLYAKDDHEPAGFTVLSFGVDDVEATVDALAAKGVETLRYDGFDQDAKGIARGGGGPDIAWFADPSGNVLAVLSEAPSAP